MLRSANLRQTRARMAILHVLLGASRPQTADEIIASLGPAGPNKVTIYRVLECFLSAGLVHKAFLQNRTWHFELAHNCGEDQCHPHFSCTDCGATHCMMEISVPKAKNTYKGFLIHRQRVQLEGLCPKCSDGNSGVT